MQGRRQRPRLDQVAHLLVVGSGKGSVGKSTISVNLTVALAKRGYQVSLLDGDAYGPSIPVTEKESETSKGDWLNDEGKD